MTKTEMLMNRSAGAGRTKKPNVIGQAVIDTDGLNEQIRCEMCKNPMHTDRGCDGHCKYDEKLYERIMQILDERIKPLPSAQPEPTTEIQEILNYLDTTLHPIVSPDNWYAYAELYDMVSSLPTAQPEQRWIPCSPETMPKKTGYYLVQYTRKYCRNEMAVAFYSVEEACCDDDYTWEIETFSDIKDVIAWMPLPEPYAERREE